MNIFTCRIKVINHLHQIITSCIHSTCLLFELRTWLLVFITTLEKYDSGDKPYSVNNYRNINSTVMCSVTKTQNKARRIFKTANISIGAIIEYTIQLSIIYKHETMLQNTNSKNRITLLIYTRTLLHFWYGIKTSKNILFLLNLWFTLKTERRTIITMIGANASKIDLKKNNETPNC